MGGYFWIAPFSTKMSAGTYGEKYISPALTLSMHFQLSIKQMCVYLLKELLILKFNFKLHALHM